MIFFLNIDRYIYKMYDRVDTKREAIVALICSFADYTIIVQGGMIMSKKMTKGILAVFFMAVCLITTQPQKVQAAQEIPIGSAEELQKMESNPSGSYYLTNDITVPANTVLFKSMDNPFTGTLDGKGYGINGYTYSADTWTEFAGLFGYAQNATFKNLNMNNVNISLRGSGNACAIVGYPSACLLENITTSGAISVSGTASYAAGIAIGAGENTTFKKCENKADITVVAYDITNTADPDEVESQEGRACGIANSAIDCTAEQCSNSGKITANGDLQWASEEIGAYGLFNYITIISESNNTGAITATNISTGYATDGTVYACGVAEHADKMETCYNTAKITASNANKNIGTIAVGIVNSTSGNKWATITKCYNTGDVQLKGVAGGKSKSRIVSGAGGIGGLDVLSITESYNTGKVTANVSSGQLEVGGISAFVRNVRNCYNTAKVSASAGASGHIGGIAGFQDSLPKGKKGSKDAAACNYNIGTVKAGKKASKGSIIGRYEILGIPDKAAVYDNYYKSGKPYGTKNITWEPYFAKAIKTSSMTAGKCSKLSSKYWVYSSKHKRMILKNNKEK